MLLKRYALVTLSGAIFLAGCGHKDEQKVYKEKPIEKTSTEETVNSKKTDKTNEQNEQQIKGSAEDKPSNDVKTSNITPVEETSNVDDFNKNLTQVPGKKGIYLLNSPAINSFIEKWNEMPDAKKKIYDRESKKSFEPNNLGMTEKLTQQYEKAFTENKDEKTIKSIADNWTHIYFDGIGYDLYGKPSQKTAIYANHHFDGNEEGNLLLGDLMRAGLSPDASTMKIYDDGDNKRWYVDYRSKDGELAARLFGTYHSDHGGYMSVEDYTTYDSGLKHFLMDYEAEQVLYGQL